MCAFVLDHSGKLPESIILKLFDHFLMRLNDANSKVNIIALKALNQMIPVLENSLEPVLNRVIQLVMSAMISTNEKIKKVAEETYSKCTQYVDPCLIVSTMPFVLATGNSKLNCKVIEKTKGIILLLLLTRIVRCDCKCIQKRPKSGHQTCYPIVLSFTKRNKKHSQISCY
jgi:hypothetical protein